jgi:hypothetical protein
MLPIFLNFGASLVSPIQRIRTGPNSKFNDFFILNLKISKNKIKIYGKFM